ncbi:hypothetical protein TWF506_003005 [Arthrobotrys conoides]|uniref:Uncharacterized protein n=1 Tax=Arthrobotrys conoides TaxID=74498 RepID=A0AAN8RUC3_9PEZI
MLRSLFSVTNRTINSVPPTVKGAATRITEILLTYVIFRTSMRVLTDLNGGPLPEFWPSNWCNCNDCMSHPKARQHFLERSAVKNN